MKHIPETSRNILKSMRLQLISYVLLFFLVPLPAVFSSSSGFDYFTNLLLIMNPAVVFGLNILYCIRNKFRWYVPLLAGAFYAPSVFIYYNITALPYAVAYIVLSYIGAAVGVSIYKGNEDLPPDL